MKTIKYKIKLRGLKSPAGTISILALRELSNIFIENSERALRLMVEGTSAKKGPIPLWLKQSLDFNVTGIKKGSTVIEVEAPQLGETAKDKIAQLDIWNIVPNPKDTAITMWAKSYKDAVDEKYESELFDRGLLNSMISFKDFLGKYAQSIELDSTTDKYASKVYVDLSRLEKVEKLTIAIPEPKTVLLCGFFNVIKHQTSRFTLNLENGEKIQGEIDKNIIESEMMRKYWGNKVTIRGLADFKPSGKIRFIKADLIKDFEEKEILFKNYLIPEIPHLFIDEVKQLYRTHSPLKEIWNKWPGDESIEEILSDLN